MPHLYIYIDFMGGRVLYLTLIEYMYISMSKEV